MAYQRLTNAIKRDEAYLVTASLSLVVYASGLDQVERKFYKAYKNRQAFDSTTIDLLVNKLPKE